MSLLAYKDIETVLINALQHMPVDGDQAVRYKLPSEREAVTWRHRANRFRKEVRRQSEINLDLPAGTGSSIYDSLSFGIEGATVVIRQRAVSGIMEVGGEIVEMEDLGEI